MSQFVTKQQAVAWLRQVMSLAVESGSPRVERGFEVEAEAKVEGDPAAVTYFNVEQLANHVDRLYMRFVDDGKGGFGYISHAEVTRLLTLTMGDAWRRFCEEVPGWTVEGESRWRVVQVVRVALRLEDAK